MTNIIPRFSLSRGLIVALWIDSGFVCFFKKQFQRSLHVHLQLKLTVGFKSFTFMLEGKN